MKKVTICVPTYNSENTIKETLDSLLNQNYENYIIKVVDNCSSDKTRDIVREYKTNKIELIENVMNLGGEGNFTRCIELSEGDLTAIFHADDVYEKNIISEQVKIFESYDIIAVATHAKVINKRGEKVGERFIPKELDKEVNILIYENFLDLVCLYGNFITCPSVMTKTIILKDVIRSWNALEFRTSADLDVWLRLSKIGKIAFLKKPLVNYRASENSHSFNIWKTRTHRHDIFLVLDKLKSDIDIEHKNLIDFLELKDESLRMINSMKTKTIFGGVQDPLETKFLSIALKSKWHFKYYLISIIIRVLYVFYIKLELNRSVKN